MGMKLVSMNSSAFTKAKARISESKLYEMVKSSGRDIDKKSGLWKWKERNVYLVDGTVLNLEDTPKINKEYPKTFSKGKSQGQPKMRLLGLFSMSSGAFLDAEIGKYSGKGQAETTLIQKMISRIRPRSVLVLDRFFTSFFLQSLFLDSEIDYVIRGRDKFSKKVLGNKTDKTIELRNPGISKYQSYSKNCFPEKIKVRVIKSSIKRKGFRVASIYIMTSFTNQKEFSKSEIEKLYLARWGVELDLRNLKCTLGAGEIKSKTPDMAKKELWVHLLAYNLVRSINLQLSNIYRECSPRKRSFKTTLKSYLEVITILGSKGLNLLIEILSKETLNAKYRREPRAIKKRHNRYCFLTVDRKKSKEQSWGYSRRKGPAALQVNGIV
jgi:hypothetical protein